MSDDATNKTDDAGGATEKLRKPRRIRLMTRDLIIAGIGIAAISLVYTGVMVWLSITGSGRTIGIFGGLGGTAIGLCGGAIGVIPAFRLRGLRAKLRESRGWLCPECEYRLDPQPEGPCPECGWHATPERVKRTWQKLLRYDEKIDFAGASRESDQSTPE